MCNAQEFADTTESMQTHLDNLAQRKKRVLFMQLSQFTQWIHLSG